MTTDVQPQLQTRPQKKDRTTTLLLLGAALVAIAGVAFAVGRLTAPPSAAAAGNTPFRNFAGARASGAPGANGFRGIGGGISGTVESVSGSTMTVKLANGSTITVDLGSNTTYHSEAAATASQVTSGSQVLVTIDTSAANGTQPGTATGASRTVTAKDVILMP